MKKEWTPPELEVTKFEVQDVIATSDMGEDGLEEYFTTESNGTPDGWTNFH